MIKSTLVSRVIGGFALFIVILILLGIFKPSLFFAIINIFWFVIFITALTIVTLGTLTFLGRKEEAKRIINMFLEGSMTVIDIVEFLGDLWRTFVQLTKDAILIAIPYFGVVLAGLVYYLIILAFKVTGKYTDVTIPTIVLSVVVTFAAGAMVAPRKTETFSRLSIRLREALVKFKRTFVDSFEVVIFLLFLTIDSTNLFFLPEGLNQEVRATVGDYDLMVRGFVLSDHTGTTFRIIAVVVSLELLRRLVKVGATFRKYYRNLDLLASLEEISTMRTSKKVKLALRKTAAVVSDDFLMFAAFTVFITLVFLLFPRLKLVALISASVAALILDLVFPARLTFEGSNDLLSRIFQKILAINPFLKGKNTKD